MPTRKDHSRYWRGADNRAQISKYQVVNGSIINFNYDTSHRIGVGDPSPLVFVMDTEDRQVRKTKDPKLQGIKKFHGINLIYLDVRIVQYFFIKLLSSFSWGESQLTKFPRVLLYDDKLIINENLIIKYFPQLDDSSSKKYQLFNQYFINFYDFCFELHPETMIKDALNFKV